ncbi:hypothetical protein SLEP1_g42459 [Rubroshorea leprosula]|uniref:Uncharacterized protein n=1 Tax=Rubroshorea leprosula TaxID=152421 RepID=A0AAV5LAA7_9ROSI|nr:hypothetical protein SLEP1_g42459 [Rubroshorea leprosula]
MISSEPCAFVGPSHECTASVASRNWVLGRDSGYTSEIASLASSWIGKRKVKGQIPSKVDEFLDDHANFNFHAYKTMLGMLALLEVSFFDKTL